MEFILYLLLSDASIVYFSLAQVVDAWEITVLLQYSPCALCFVPETQERFVVEVCI